ncbi:uncharacterized protein LOC112033426 [Quercus suber]|uniref:uncharacterized protein LOC112033426 n=1 Tax=Quercus suber TaxID=58331 RepID=UPI000CE26240|nr:brain acid soluble protein 1-like [Quercus suber]
MAEEWVRDKSNQARVEAHSRAEIEKILRALKEEHAELTNKLTVSEREHLSAVAGLKSTETQAEDQRKKLYMTELKLATQKQQVLDLKVELKKARKAAHLAKEALEAEKQALMGSSQAGDHGQGVEGVKDKSKGEEKKPSTGAKDTTKAEEGEAKTKEAELQDKEVDPEAKDSATSQPSQKENSLAPKTKA